MYYFNARVSRGVLGLTLVAALAACLDDTTPMEAIRPLDPQFGVGDVITVTNTSGGTEIGSLRWAVGLLTGGEVIRFDPALAGQTIVLDTTIVTFKRFTLEGPATRGITISGGGKGRVIHTIGSAGDTTVLRNVTITGGRTSGLSGAGISSSHRLIVENSTITGNVGGAYPAINGTNVTLINSTVSGNEVLLPSPSGAVHAVAAHDTLTLVNSTIAHNTGGGALGVRLILRNSVISNNTHNNCLSNNQSIVREGNNISDDDSCGAPFEIMLIDPQLGPLADNGGPARTHAITAGSPAINAGTNCTVAVDQRYAPRDTACDLGAFEFLDFTTVELTIAPSVSNNRSTGLAVITGTVKCSRPESFDLNVALTQAQKSGQNTIRVHAAANTHIVCGTSVQPWGVAVVANNQPFETGSATASASMVNPKPWVTPAIVSQPVRLFNSHK